MNVFALIILVFMVVAPLFAFLLSNLFKSNYDYSRGYYGAQPVQSTQRARNY